MGIKTISSTNSSPMLLKTTRRYLKKSNSLHLTSNCSSFSSSCLKFSCKPDSTQFINGSTTAKLNNLYLSRRSHTAVKQISSIEYKNLNQSHNPQVTQTTPILSPIESLALRILEEPGNFKEFRGYLSRKDVKNSYLYLVRLISKFEPLREIINDEALETIENNINNNELDQGFKETIMSLNFKIFNYRESIGFLLHQNNVKLRKFSSICCQFFNLLNSLPNELAVLQLTLVPFLPKTARVPSMIKCLTRISISKYSEEFGNMSLYFELMPEIIDDPFGKSLVFKKLLKSGKFEVLEDVISNLNLNTDSYNKVNLNLLLWGYTQLKDEMRVKFILSMFYKLKIPLTNYGYSSLMRHYGNNQQLGRCLKLIERIIKEGEVPNEVIMTNLVNNFAKLKDLKSAEYYYERSLELGHINNIRLMTIMFNLYIELNEQFLAKNLFRQIVGKFNLDPALVGVVTKWLTTVSSNGNSTSPHDFLTSQWALLRNLPTLELTGILSNYLKYHGHQFPIPNLLQLIDQFILLKPEPTFCIDVFNQILKIILKTSSTSVEESYYLKILSSWLEKHNIQPNIVTHHIMLTKYLQSNRLTEAINLFCLYFPHLSKFPFDRLNADIYKTNLGLNPPNLKLGKRKLDIELVNLFMQLCLKLQKPKLVPVLLLTSHSYHLAPNSDTYQLILKACLLSNDFKTLNWCLHNTENAEHLPMLANAYIQLVTRTLYSKEDRASEPLLNSRFLQEIVKIYETTLRFIYSRGISPEADTICFMITTLNQIEDPSKSTSKIHYLLKLIRESSNNNNNNNDNNNNNNEGTEFKLNFKNNQILINFNEKILKFLKFKINYYLN